MAEVKAVPVVGMYGVDPVINLREPEDHERRASCNTCHAPNVTTVLEIGSRRHGGGASLTVLRLCGACTRLLREAVS